MTQDLLQQYIDNSCSPEQRHAVEEWLQNAGEADIDLVMLERWNTASTLMPEKEKSDLWKRLYLSIDPLVAQPAPVKKLPVRRWTTIAAAAILVLTSLLLLRLNTGSGWDTISNNTTVARQVQLPDGSSVWLNGSSSIAYNKNFNSRNREVKLKGEAYFIVKGDKEKPFVVYAGHLATKVLGTEFNVEAYEQEAAVKVSLTKGKVAVGFIEKEDPASPSKMLEPGQMLLSKGQQELTVQPIAVQRAEAWKEGHFVVNDMSLEEILKRMEKRYGIHFHIEGEEIPATVCKNVAATFDGSDWQQIIKQLCFTCHFRYSIKGKEVFLEYVPQ